MPFLKQQKTFYHVSVDLFNNDPQHRVYTEDTVLLHLSLSGRSAVAALFSPQQLNQLHVKTGNTAPLRTQASSAAPQRHLAALQETTPNKNLR